MQRAAGARGREEGRRAAGRLPGDLPGVGFALTGGGGPGPVENTPKASTRIPRTAPNVHGWMLLDSYCRPDRGPPAVPGGVHL